MARYNYTVLNARALWGFALLVCSWVKHPSGRNSLDVGESFVCLCTSHPIASPQPRNHRYQSVGDEGVANLTKGRPPPATRILQEALRAVIDFACNRFANFDVQRSNEPHTLFPNMGISLVRSTIPGHVHFAFVRPQISKSKTIHPWFVMKAIADFFPTIV